MYPIPSSQSLKLENDDLPEITDGVSLHRWNLMIVAPFGLLLYFKRTWYKYVPQLDTVWARQQETPNMGKPEVLIGAPSSNNLEHRLL